MSDYLELTIRLFDEHQQERAQVRKAITVEALIQEILHEFSELNRETTETYALYREGDPHPIPRDRKIQSLDLQPHDVLVFGWLKFTGRQFLEAPQAILRNDKNRSQVFPLQWQPALIGRPDSGALHNELLAVNVETLAGGMHVSRRHAQIIQENGQYYLESLAATNPTYINETQVLLTEKRPLRMGDKIRLGRSNLVFTFITLDTSPETGDSPPKKSRRKE